MAESKKQSYLHGAAIMTVGVLIVKVLGAAFKIPLGSMKLLGDEGFGYFQSAYNIYTMFLTLATAGFPVALSRMISEAEARGRTTQVQRTFRVALLFLAALGGVSCLSMMLWPDAFAYRLGSVKAMQGIFVLGPSVLLVCLISVYRGYCQGQGNMTPTTVSQVLEVAVKVPVGLLLAWLLVRAGKGLPLASAGAIVGVMAGSAAALLYLMFYVRRHYDRSAVGGECDSGKKIFVDLLRIGVPITLGGCILSIINLVDNAQILNRLQAAAGFSAVEANTLYGIYGKVQTLYMLPSYFMAPFQASVVPAIAACVAARQRREKTLITDSALRCATVVVMPMCVGLGVLSYPIINVLWPGSHEAGPVLLSYLAAAAFFVCTTMLTNALLQANGLEKLSMISMVCGGTVKVAVNYFLIGNPAINIRGAAISSILCFATMTALNFFFLSKCQREKLGYFRYLPRPVLSCGAMGLGAWGVYGLLSRLMSGGEGLGRFGMLLSLGAAIAMAVLVYFVLIVLTRSITAEDMKLIPKGEKLAALLHIR